MDRPIKGSTSGKYNMDFIDETNDICGYYSNRSGVDKEHLEQLINRYFQEVEISQESDYVPGDKLRPGYYDRVKSERVAEQSSKQCSVCLEHFEKGQHVKMLPCKHMFHHRCVQPWFSNNTRCPNCRFDLNEHFGSSH